MHTQKKEAKRNVCFIYSQDKTPIQMEGLAAAERHSGAHGQALQSDGALVLFIHSGVWCSGHFLQKQLLLHKHKGSENAHKHAQPLLGF